MVGVRPVVLLFDGDVGVDEVIEGVAMLLSTVNVEERSRIAPPVCWMTAWTVYEPSGEKLVKGHAAVQCAYASDVDADQKTSPPENVLPL